MKFHGKLDLKPISKMLNNRGLDAYGRVQKFIDNEVVKCCDPYVPFDNGELKKAKGTKIGSGRVVYGEKYSHRQYYGNKGKGKEGTSNGGIRGRLWFERMKSDHLPSILRGAKNIAGGK